MGHSKADTRSMIARTEAQGRAMIEANRRQKEAFKRALLAEFKRRLNSASNIPAVHIMADMFGKLYGRKKPVIKLQDMVFDITFMGADGPFDFNPYFKVVLRQ